VTALPGKRKERNPTLQKRRDSTEVAARFRGASRRKRRGQPRSGKLVELFQQRGNLFQSVEREKENNKREEKK